MERATRCLLVAGGAYVAAQMTADIASLRIISFAGWAVDAGTLVYPFTFTLRDVVHRVGGKAAARTMIWLAAAANLAMSAVFLIVAKWAPDMSAGPQPEFGDLLAPVWGIVVASIVAEVVAELIDTEVYSMWARRFGDRRLWGRVAASNAVAVPVDSVIFVGLASLFGVFPAGAAATILWVNVVIKAAVALISIPMIYWAPPSDRL